MSEIAQGGSKKSDIAEECREMKRYQNALKQDWSRQLGTAADEIDRLEAENTRLRKALEAIAHTFTEDSHGNTKTMDAPFYQGIARAALETKP